GVEPIEMHEGPDEGLLREVLGVRAPEDAPAEAIHRVLKAEHELIEGRRIAAPSPAGEVTLRVQVVRIPRLRRRHAPRALTICGKNTGQAREYFRATKDTSDTQPRVLGVRLAPRRRREARHPRR